MATQEPTSAGTDRPLHRLKEVREIEGISLRSLARRMNKRVSELKAQEDEQSDIRLTDLYRWQQVLKVPLDDLLVEPEDQVSLSVLERSRLLRIARTAKSLLRQTSTPASRRLAEKLLDQLYHIMPELEHVSAWHEYCVRRVSGDASRTEERVISIDDLRYDPGSMD